MPALGSAGGDYRHWSWRKAAQLDSKDDCGRLQDDCGDRSPEVRLVAVCSLQQRYSKLRGPPLMNGRSGTQSSPPRQSTLD